MIIIRHKIDFFETLSVKHILITCRARGAVLYTIFLEINLLQVTILFNSSQCNTNYVQVPGSRDPVVSAAGGVLGVQHAAAEPGYQQTSPCSQHDCRHGVTIRIIISHYDNNTGCCKTSGKLCKPFCDTFLGVILLFLC